MLTGDVHVGATYELASVRATVADLAARHGTTVEVVTPEEWAVTDGAGLEPRVREWLVAMFRHYDAHGLPAGTETMRALLGRGRAPRPTDSTDSALSEVDLGHLRTCVALAREALEAGDEPFGSVLVDATGAVRFRDRNRVKDGDETRHPELEVARWSAAHLSADERAARDRLHLRRALPDVLGGARLDGARPDRLRGLVRPAGRLARRVGPRPRAGCCHWRSTRSHPTSRSAARPRSWSTRCEHCTCAGCGG